MIKRQLNETPRIFHCYNPVYLVNYFYKLKQLSHYTIATLRGKNSPNCHAIFPPTN